MASPFHYSPFDSDGRDFNVGDPGSCYSEGTLLENIALNNPFRADLIQEQYRTQIERSEDKCTCESAIEYHNIVLQEQAKELWNLRCLF